MTHNQQTYSSTVSYAILKWYPNISILDTRKICGRIGDNPQNCCRAITVHNPGLAIPGLPNSLVLPLYPSDDPISDSAITDRLYRHRDPAKTIALKESYGQMVFGHMKNVTEKDMSEYFCFTTPITSCEFQTAVDFACFEYPDRTLLKTVSDMYMECTPCD